MNKNLFQTVLESDKDSFAKLTEDMISSKISERMESVKKDIAESIFIPNEVVSEENAFISVVNECAESSSSVNVDLPDGERIVVSEEIATILSEAHDNLPQELQKSFRDTVFESKEKFASILETIVSGENDGQ